MDLLGCHRGLDNVADSDYRARDFSMARRVNQRKFPVGFYALHAACNDMLKANICFSTFTIGSIWGCRPWVMGIGCGARAHARHPLIGNQETIHFFLLQIRMISASVLATGICVWVAWIDWSLNKLGHLWTQSAFTCGTYTQNIYACEWRSSWSDDCGAWSCWSVF